VFGLIEVEEEFTLVPRVNHQPPHKLCVHEVGSLQTREGGREGKEGGRDGGREKDGGTEGRKGGQTTRECMRALCTEIWVPMYLSPFLRVRVFIYVDLPPLSLSTLIPSLPPSLPLNPTSFPPSLPLSFSPSLGASLPPSLPFIPSSAVRPQI